MKVCSGGARELYALASPCSREFWSAVLPAGFVAFVLLSLVPIPTLLRRTANAIKRPFTEFMSLPEAEALDAGEDVSEEEILKEASPVPLWRSVLLAFVAVVETLVWLGVSARAMYLEPEDPWKAVCAFLVALSWFYAAGRPVVAPTATVPSDLLILFFMRFVLSLLMFGGVLFDHAVYRFPLPSPLVLVAYTADLVAVALLLLVVVNMPLAIPSRRVNKAEIGKSISPEDYTTLLGWASFMWVMPLIDRGTVTTLSEDDVWALSPTMQARPLYIKFMRSKSLSLLRRLWSTNSKDMILDAVLSIVSVVFNYAGPFFLKRILDALDSRSDPTAEMHAIAYVFAFLAFLSTLCKAESDVQHLWYSRRASVRARSELMTAIYDKALKRKDFSGIIDKEKVKEAKEAKDAKGKAPESAKPAEKKDPKIDDPKAGADIGKIVNLMAGDAGRIANVISGMYMIYGAPFEIAIASTFLYQLMGFSAFAGFIILVVGWPLNNYVAKRAVRIQKGVSTARDKRMSVLNELIGAVKFIKFFAWEERWTERVMDAREVEMQWMVKSRVNNVMFSLIWTTAPILLSVTSFTVYVLQGNELTVGTAFTAIALFSMIRAPLNVIPAWIVQVLQAKVALDRIATYLEEEEVDEQVSSLKRGHVKPADVEEEGFGIVNGTFKWNEVEEKDEGKDKNGKQKQRASSDSGSDETNTVVEGQSSAGDTEGDMAVDMTHRFELRDISVMFPEGELSVVTGPTGSGKTALLMALLGELTRLEGRIVMSKNPSKVDEHGLSHTISYSAQSPWLRHQSIKDNIIFGYPYDEERYNAVVECCALQTDLSILEDGDATEIGARGVSLSGGQKARVALARAVYARSKYVLLDDPLSAVDSHTARFLFERLLCGPLLEHRTVILVTHHVELVLPGAHYLVRMLDGRIDTQGMIKDLRAQGVLDYITHDESVEAHKEEQQAQEEETKGNPNAEIDAEGSPETAVEAAKPKSARKLVEEEKRETGSVKWSIYNTYLKASSYWTWIILFTLVVATQFLGVSEKLWIKVWGEAYGAPNSTSMYMYKPWATSHHDVLMDESYHNLQLVQNAVAPSVPGKFLGINWPPAQQHPFFYVGIYLAITLSTGLVNITAVITQYTGALRASRVLFGQMLRTVVRAPMRWHDVTPQGRMLNRFSKDIETVDSSLASSLQYVNTSLASFAASIITVVVVFPLFVIPASILSFFYRRAAIGYLHTGRDLRRMESVTRSPIFANFNELLEGIVTVRAFSAEQHFLENLYTKVDLTTKMWYSFWMTNRWLLLYFDSLGACAILATTLFALAGYVEAGIAGVSITSAMSFTTSVYWACRFWTSLELDLNSVERVVEYLDLPQEPPAVIDSNRPPAYWPSSSSPNKDSMIAVEDLVIKYSPELPAVLHGVSFTLKAKERIGLLGRTGSGKSTLAMSILRFVDPSSGRILIDGVDISSIGLHDLRSRITFIPQDAALFSGTLRDNLDPFGEHEDSECLDVLYRVQMLTDSQLESQKSSREPSRPASILEREGTIASVSTSATETEGKTVITLDTQVSAGGTNFSQGQRQLIAMARALLRRSSIIVLDEATSSIDFATDAKIQATIREEFNDSLLLTVAHRLRTVIDYDRLLILDKGELVEFDTPLNLIQEENGIFRNMCLKSGTFAELEAAAKAKAERDLL
ncbi:ATP-dependent bile acid permease [Sparassis crispa]|uniref:ATP-dependent bile acid permease n=1 Tax=Sparassis crispa TaxID=139825 RepID=A0A401GYS4_9APHY|nr:ATP-dependent bile acid permease [Sparassis crispa]GBE87310.1 ATP-dependent bile acid permease [Sparassis crispa]